MLKWFYRRSFHWHRLRLPQDLGNLCSRGATGLLANGVFLGSSSAARSDGLVGERLALLLRSLPELDVIGNGKSRRELVTSVLATKE